MAALLRVLAGAWLASLTVCGTAAAAPCADLARETLSDTTIELAVNVQAGTPIAIASGRSVTPDRAFCRVQGTIRPTLVSIIKFEVWLPADWNGNFYQAGNGGLAGAIQYAGLVQGLRHGYAAASTDDGSGPPGSNEFLHEPERRYDFTVRAVHVTATIAKELTRRFYGRQASHAYFVGGSKGGQEALMEAQRFPQDFDGIVASYPGAWATYLQAQMIWATQQMHREPGAKLNEAKLQLLHDHVIAACAGRDGGLPTDSFLTYPPACTFDPATLQCRGADAPDCLTAAEARTAAAIYRGPGNPRTGVSFRSGSMPGSEAPVRGGHGWAGYYGMYVNLFVAPNMARNVLNKPDWDYRTFNFDQDLAALEESSAPTESFNPDLRAFKARGGKLILIHGWNDPMMPPMHSPIYFERVVADQASAPDRPASRSALDETRRFFRLFMVPGLGHGTSIGLRPVDPLPAITAWVEKGQAPDTLPAVQHVDDDPGKGIVLTRGLCAWPEVMRADSAGQFACGPAPQPTGR